MKQYIFVPNVLARRKKKSSSLYKLQEIISFIQLVLSLLYHINQCTIESH